jgi:epoxyqueuosine reductase
MSGRAPVLTAEREPQSPSPQAIKLEVRAKARELGFDAVGFTRPELDEASRRNLDSFLARGLFGEMEWLAANAERRGNPRALWPEARSIVVLGANYGPANDPRRMLSEPKYGSISVYAQGEDYHKLLKKRLKELGRWMAERFGSEARVFVDTAPVMEKPLAQKAGLGWQGKHTNLVSRDFGSWLFLAELFTSLDLPPDRAETDHCGACARCIDSCPTAAITGAGRLDPRRCISYLTIESKGHIGREFREAIGNRIYGCDDCLAACPWNKFARRSTEFAFQPRIELTAPRLIELSALDDASFRELFRGSPIKRTGRDRFIRNVMIALGNTRDPACAETVEARLADSSALVRAMAVWALSRLLDMPSFAGLRAIHLPGETDKAVREEWENAEVAPPTRIDAYGFDLPRERIAKRPCAPRDASRLLNIGERFQDRTFRDLPSLLEPGDLLVFNDTRVIPARLFGTRDGRRGTAKIEVTLHKEAAPGLWDSFARPAKRLRPGDVIDFAGGFRAEVTKKHASGEIRLLLNRRGDDLRAALMRFGRLPLPPYIEREEGADKHDTADYQTVYARVEGAVAAPTAGLHFTERLLHELDSRGIGRAFVTLHVGAGTFLPMRAEDLRDHRMHSERGVVGEAAARAINETRACGGRIIAVGTTSLRLIEAAADESGLVHPFDAETGLFITPGYRFRVAEKLLTNFHLPRSTLFVLVSAFAGIRRARHAYEHAKKHGYRFYSYGDACLIERAGSP